MALAGALGVRTDPLLAYNFVITLLDTSSALASAVSAAKAAVSDVALGGFTECSGLEMSLDVEEYKEGGRNSEILQFPTRVKWNKITLKKGIGSGTALWDWHYGFAAGSGKRRDGLIVLLNELRAPNNIWYFRRGLPTRYAGPTLNAAQNSVAIETIEIAHEGIFQLPFVGTASSVATAAATAGVL
jgi:phage tail-like protein